MKKLKNITSAKWLSLWAFSVHAKLVIPFSCAGHFQLSFKEQQRKEGQHCWRVSPDINKRSDAKEKQEGNRTKATVPTNLKFQKAFSFQKQCLLQLQPRTSKLLQWGQDCFVLQNNQVQAGKTDFLSQFIHVQPNKDEPTYQPQLAESILNIFHCWSRLHIDGTSTYIWVVKQKTRRCLSRGKERQIQYHKGRK